MFYNNFIKLCSQNNQKPSYVAQCVGISKSAVTAWKKGNSNPNSGTLNKLADYFNVSVDYLLGNEDKKNKTADEQQPYTQELNEIIQITKDFSKEELTKAREYIRFIKSQRNL